MATINVGGRTVEVPDNLDLPQRTLRSPSMGSVSNPNVARGVLSAEGAAWQRSQAAPAVAPAAAPATPAAPRPGLRDQISRGVAGARSGMANAQAARLPQPAAPTGLRSLPGRAKSLAGRAGTIGAGAAAIESFNDYKIDDPSVDSSAAGTLGYLANGEFAQAGRSLSKGALETGMDVASFGAKALDALPGVEGMSDRLNRGLRSRFGSQLIDNTGGVPAGSPSPSATPAVSPTSAAAPLAAGAGPATPGTPTQNNIIRTVGPDGRVTYSGGNVGADAQIINASTGGLRQPNLSVVPGAGSFAPATPIDAVASVAAPTVRHSGNDWAARNALRNAQVSANSITNNGGQWDPRRRGDVSDARMLYGAMVKNDLELQAADPTLAADITKSNNSLRGQSIESGNRLRGDIYSADQRLRGSIYDANATAATARAKAAGEAAGKQNDLDIENAKRAREQVTIYGPDGKPDEAATQRAVLAIDKILPGYSTMSEQARKEHSGDASAIANIFNRTRGQSELGVGQAIFGNTNPELDSMPNFQGGQLKRSGLLGGVPGGAGVNGWYMDMGDRQIALGQDLSERELEMLRHNTATGQWLPGKKKD